ncbi:arylsulfatase B-like [Argiope bruennichi]|uniref:Arylsulfatase B like protein n=1 Tax=Argiope bruennichi TaxID=94029 RepID=A0A8T0FKR1_ARGBR|nr:arylsulfatase B-like [Argiope bruennichi]KAF8791804.1 Arylsulfatase B like protein [Argiope bruennichi]
MYLYPQISVLLFLIIALQGKEIRKPPHIIFIFADDLGMNDISLRGSPQIPTPNIDALGLNGLFLDNYYGEWLCTPSRGAFLTGKYPSRLGLQHSALRPGEASGLPLREKTLPQHLKKLGYKTHMVGKWHLGYQNKEYTPTYRGFDSYFGYYSGYIGYYDHTVYDTTHLDNNPVYFGLDFHNGTEIVTDKQGKYATHLFTETAEQIIRNHDASQPLFLYLAHLAIHSGNPFKPAEAPPEVISKFKHVKDFYRRIHAATVSVLDDGVGTVFRALHEKDMLKNSIFMFVSDNGGEVNPREGGYGSNYPLRGNKESPWEGGIRVPAIIWSPLLNLKKPLVAKQLMHVSDWLPTLYKAAGGDPRDLGPIDGFDMWDTFLEDSPSPRTYMLQNLDPLLGTSAFRMRDLKVVNGNTSRGFDFWYGPSGFESFNRPATFEWVFNEGSVVEDVLKEMGMWIVENPYDVYERLRINCQKPPPKDAYSSCQPDKNPCLFNITDDPCEYKNIADQHPEMVEKMIDIINMYKVESMEPQAKPSDPRGDPMCHNFLIVPWLDPENYNECDFALGSSVTSDH